MRLLQGVLKVLHFSLVLVLLQLHLLLELC